MNLCILCGVVIEMAFLIRDRNVRNGICVKVELTQPIGDMAARNLWVKGSKAYFVVIFITTTTTYCDMGLKASHAQNIKEIKF